jgi:hypothetical protein
VIVGNRGRHSEQERQGACGEYALRACHVVSPFDDWCLLSGSVFDGPLSGEQSIQFASAVQRGDVVVAAEVLTVDEDLWYRRAAGTLAHFELTDAVVSHIDRGAVRAFVIEEAQGTLAVWAPAFEINLRGCHGLAPLNVDTWGVSWTFVNNRSIAKIIIFCYQSSITQ